MEEHHRAAEAFDEYRRLRKVGFFTAGFGEQAVHEFASIDKIKLHCAYAFKMAIAELCAVYGCATKLRVSKICGV